MIIKKILVGVIIALSTSLLGWGVWVTHTSYTVLSMAADIEENKEDVKREREERTKQVKDGLNEVKYDIKEIQKEQKEILKLLIEINRKTG